MDFPWVCKFYTVPDGVGLIYYVEITVVISGWLNLCMLKLYSHVARL